MQNSITIIPLLILILATWRVSYMLVNEDGPYDIFANFRYNMGVRTGEFIDDYGITMPGKLLLCIKCTSVWVGIVYTIVYTISPTIAVMIALPFALSAVVFIISDRIG